MTVLASPAAIAAAAASRSRRARRWPDRCSRDRGQQERACRGSLEAQLRVARGGESAGHLPWQDGATRGELVRGAGPGARGRGLDIRGYGPDGGWVVPSYRPSQARSRLPSAARRPTAHRGQQRRAHPAQRQAGTRGQPLAGHAGQVAPGERCRRVSSGRGAPLARRPRLRGVAASGPGSSGARHRPACPARASGARIRRRPAAGAAVRPR